MRSTTCAILAALAACLADSSFAQSVSSRFTLDHFPELTSSEPLPEGVAPVGHWTGPNATGGYMTTYSPAHGGLQDKNFDEYTDPPGPPHTGLPFSHRSGSFPATGGRHASAEIEIGQGSISTRVHLTEPTAVEVAHARTFWTRWFELSPHSAVTLSGFVDFEGPGSDHANTTFIKNMAEIDGFSVQAMQARREVTIGAGLRDPEFDPDHHPVDRNVLTPTQAFSGSTSEDGHLSFTVTNTADTPLYGSFSVYVEVYAATPAVPEPERYLGMLMGTGFLAMVRRRRGKSPATALG